MKTNSYTTKIGVCAVLLAIISGVLFGYGLPWAKAKLDSSLSGIMEQKKEVVELRQEQRNLELAKKDLAELASKHVLPEDFFSKDVTLVNNLGVLESKARELGVLLTVSISGTVASAPKAKTPTELYMVPFTMQLEGDFANVVAYMDWLEHAGTLFVIRSVTAAGSQKDTIVINLLGTVYLRK